MLVRATNWIGDTVISLPALEAVRENFPESEIVVLARPWVIPLIEHHPAVDRIILLKKGRPLSGFIELIRVARLLRKKKFDMAILFQNAFEAALLTYMGGVKNRIGYNLDWRGLLLTHSIRRDDPILKEHQVEYYLSILRSMGWNSKTGYPRLWIGKRDSEAAESLLLSGGIGKEEEIIGLSPGAAYGPAKRWPAERFALVGDWASERWGSKVLLIGGPGENRVCRALAGAMKYSPVNLCGKTTLGQAMAIIKRCDFFITNDSGLMHVAAALDVPMIAIFGSTDPIATGPISQRARVVRKKADCAPCLKKECPSDFRCMLSITPEDVWEELTMLKEETG